MTQATPPFPHAGELAGLTASIIWAFTLCAYRVHAAGLPSVTVNLFKNCVSFTCLLATALLAGAAWPSAGSTWGWLALSGFMGLCVSDTAMFAALQRLGAQRTAAIQCLGPPMAALLAFYFLGEELKAVGIVGMTLTVAAVAGVVLLGPRDHLRLGPDWSLGLLLAIGAAAAQAVGLVMARDAFQQADVMTGTLIRLAPAIAVLGLVVGQRGPQARLDLLFDSRLRVGSLAMAAFFGGFLGLFLLSAATKFAPAGIAATLTSTFPLWLIPVARVFLKERITLAQGLCTLLAVGGIALMFLE